MSTRRTCIAAAALVLPLVAHGQVTYEPSKYIDDRWYITPFGSYIFSDSDRRSKDDWGGGLAIGKPINPNWNIELRGMYEELSPDTTVQGKYTNWSASLDAQYYFTGRQGIRLWQKDTVQPYLVAGIGAINDRVKGTSTTAGDDKTSFMANAGAGIVWPFASWGRLVGDARYRWDDNRGNFGRGGHFGDWILSVGLQIPLGTPPRVAEAPRAAPPAPPPPAPKPEAKPTPPPPPPKKPVAQRFELSSDGTFVFDKAILTDVGKSRIDKMVQELRAQGVTVTSMAIAGYTDPLGSTQYNERLSMDRANAVREHMVSQGIPAAVIRAEGRGESNLKVTEADCRAKGQAKSRTALIACLEPNRRVEIQAAGEKSD